ncbi:hypothetical protein BGX38DRAFT_326500 [Terfezia claveryi]|nr:hypothetical protein BGX38DRAFT_326500 [Terfezia claveryi]
MRNIMKAPSALRSIFCCFPKRASASAGKVSRVHATSLQPWARPLHSSSWSVHCSALSSTPSWQSSTPVPSTISSHNTILPPKALPSKSLLPSSNRAHFRTTFQAQSQARAQSTQTEPLQDLQRTQPQALPRQNWITRTYGRRWWGSSKLYEDSTMLVAFSILISWVVDRLVKKWKVKHGKPQTPPEPETTPGYQKLKWWEQDPRMVVLYLIGLTVSLGTVSVAWLLWLFA